MNQQRVHELAEGARALAEGAGFSQFQKLPIQHPLNQFFALAA